MTTIKLTDEETTQLENSVFIDVNQEWKFMKPFYYKLKCGYHEVYLKEEYNNEMDKLSK